MTNWNSSDLEKIGAAEELDLRSERADGVTFHEADPTEYAGVDAAFRDNYGHYTSIVEHVLTDRARASALRLEPR